MARYTLKATTAAPTVVKIHPRVVMSVPCPRHTMNRPVSTRQMLDRKAMPGSVLEEEMPMGLAGAVDRLVVSRMRENRDPGSNRRAAGDRTTGADSHGG